MSAILKTQPRLPIDNVGNNSRWLPAWLPIIFNFRREDFPINEIGDSAASPSIGIDINLSTDITSELIVGDSIFFNDVTHDVKGTANILDFSYDIGSDVTTVTLDYTTSIGAIGSVAGYINLLTARKFYKLEVKNTYYATGSEIIPNVLGEFTPDYTGAIKVNMMSWCQKMISADDKDYVYPKQYAAPLLGQAFRIFWRETYRTPSSDYVGGYTSISSPSNNIYYATHATRQLNNKNGNNMGEFVMFPVDSSIQQIKGKFLTMFENPTWFVGFPYDVQFLYDYKIHSAGQNISQNETSKDLNGSTISNKIVVLNDTGYNSCVNRITLNSLPPNDTDIIDLVLKGVIVDLPASTDASAIIGTPATFDGVELIREDTGDIIGYSDWVINLDLTLAQLIISMATNMPNGTPTPPGNFDNAIGFSATINIGTMPSSLIVSAPPDTYDLFNGVSIKIISTTGASQTITSVVLSGGNLANTPAPAPVNNDISQIMTINVESDCMDSPVYLKWLNPIGGFDYWCFKFRRISSETTSNEIGYSKYVENAKSSNTRYEVLNVDVQPQINIGAQNLSKDDMNGIKYVLRSPKVLMYQGNDENGLPLWLGITVNRDVYQIDDSRETKNELDFIINLPLDFNQNQ